MPCTPGVNCGGMYDACADRPTEEEHQSYDTILSTPGAVKRIGAYVPISCCQAADAGIEGVECSHRTTTLPYRPTIRTRIRSRWNAGRARVARWLYPGIFNEED